MTSPLRVLSTAVVVALSAASLLVSPARGYAQPAEPAPPAPAASVLSLSNDALTELVANATPDAPSTLTLANRPIVVFRAAIVGRSSADRAGAARQLLTRLAGEGRVLEVASRELAGAVLLTVDGRDVFAIVPADIDPLRGETLQETARQTVDRLQLAFDETREASAPFALLAGLAQALLATAAFVCGLWLLARVRRSAAKKASHHASKTLTAHKVADELARHTRLLYYVQQAVTIGAAVLALVLVYVWLTFVLRRFPYTRPWGESLRTFLLDQLAWVGAGIVAAVPSLFTVLLIASLTRGAVKVVQRLFSSVEQGRIAIPWIYPETAVPTRKLVTGLLWLFALAIRYPYLPGSQTEAFKGISVFVGLMVSLGSSGLVNQIMSGFTITYSRALRPGDFVRVGDFEGTVTQIGTLSTKLETARREEVTIPNAVLVSHTVVNYSRNADSTGVYTPTAVTIGYDAPWRQVEALLLLAADRTDGVRRTPPPRVQQSSLEDFYVRYTLLVALETPQRRGPILALLHANIQDAFNEHGVQIMSPNYEADPEGPKMVPKEKWFAAPAADTKNTAAPQG